jgi:hypothetical protein
VRAWCRKKWGRDSGFDNCLALLINKPAC